ncbi:ionotropic receptor 75a-like [Bacillus rossius redtenbacheri]|uniref:ionotropic receptor 75a-like n=1 Tax=Bacillus rossius redtenbacheri TaxID=93214 RepID=UPI002FDE453D
MADAAGRSRRDLGGLTLRAGVVVSRPPPPSPPVHTPRTAGDLGGLTLRAGVVSPAFPPPIRSPRTAGDLGGLTLRAGVVVLEDAWENRFDMRRKHLNTWSKISYSLMTYVSEMLNFRMEETQVDSWGYPDERGSFSGLVGLLQRNESDIGAVGCIITTARMRACQYAGETTPFRPRFIFREPPLSSVSNIYTMPFSARVWRVYAATVLLLTAALLAAQRAEASLAAWPEDARPAADWGEALLASLGVICQQGCSRTPDGMSSRTLFFVLFILSVFFFTSYSAIIVSLLQSPSSSINTLAELIESPLKIAFDDIVYNHKYDNYVSETSSPVIWKLFHEDILLRPKHQAFLRQEHGVQLMRRGMMAFHVDMSAYKIIADTWNEMDKCDLKEVFMFPAYVFAIPVQTGSPYREMITVKLRWLREAGYISREWRRWATEKPVCEHSTNFISVGLQDFRAALLILVCGVLASFAALLLELGAHHSPRLWRGRARRSVVHELGGTRILE